MNRFKRYYGIAILCALACPSLSATPERNPKQRAIATIKEEIELFRDAIEGTQKCITRKPCPRKQKQAMFRAAKHGFAIIAIMAGLGTLVYKAFPQKTPLGVYSERSRAIILGDLMEEIQQLSDDKLGNKIAKLSLSQNILDELLLMAIHYGTDVAVKKLLKSGASAGFADKKNASLLWHAATRGGSIDKEREQAYHTRIIDLLLKEIDRLPNKKALINLKSDDQQSTALMQAAAKHNVVLVRKLLDAGADKTLTNEYGLTAYDYAKNSEKLPETIAPAAMLDSLRLPK